MSTTATKPESARAMRVADGLEQRVLVLTPSGDDAAVVCRVLGEAGFDAETCADVVELCAEIGRGTAAVLVSDEALSDESRRRLGATLAEQPAWSELPLLVMISRSRERRVDLQALGRIEAAAHPTVLERPLHTATLVSAVRAAVESRRRQYQVRDELAARKQAEVALGEVNRRLHALMEALPVGVSFSEDTTCQRITGNSTVLAQFGITPSDNLSASAPADTAAGRQIHYLVEGRELSDTELPLQRAVAEGRVIRPMEIEVRLSADRSWIAEVSAAPIHDARGNVVGGVAVTIDITERKRIEKALRELNEMLEARVAERTAVAERRTRDLRRMAAQLSEAEHLERKRLSQPAARRPATVAAGRQTPTSGSDRGAARSDRATRPETRRVGR